MNATILARAGNGAAVREAATKREVVLKKPVKVEPVESVPARPTKRFPHGKKRARKNPEGGK